MKTGSTTKNAGQFSSWHMERKAENKYSKSDSTTRPEAGTSSKYLKTDGRPAGTQFVENSWFDGGSGARGARAHELSKFNGTASEKQSANDAPFMAGDRARTADGTLRQVRGDQKVSNNPTLQRESDIAAKFGDITVGELRTMFGGMSVKQIANMSQAQRAKVLARNASTGQTAQTNVTNSLAQIMQQN